VSDAAFAVMRIARVVTATDIHGMVIHPAIVYERDGGVFTCFR
jgi:hypothetical protein